MNAVKLQKQEKNLKAAGLMTGEEKLIDCIQVSRYDNLIFGFGQWKSGGWGYFAENQFIFLRFATTMVIPYNMITKIEKSTQFFLPLGIKITYNNGTKEVTERFSMQKRDRWIAFLSEKSNVTCS